LAIFHWITIQLWKCKHPDFVFFWQKDGSLNLNNFTGLHVLKIFKAVLESVLIGLSLPTRGFQRERLEGELRALLWGLFLFCRLLKSRAGFLPALKRR